MTENSPQTEIIRPEEIAAALAKDRAAGKISIIDEDHLLTHPEDGTEPVEVSTEDYIRSFDRFSQAYDGVIMQAKAQFFYQSQAKTPKRFLDKPLKRPEVANILAVLSVAVLSALMFWSFVFAHPLLQSLNTPGARSSSSATSAQPSASLSTASTTATASAISPPKTASR